MKIVCDFSKISSILNFIILYIIQYVGLSNYLDQRGITPERQSFLKF